MRQAAGRDERRGRRRARAPSRRAMPSIMPAKPKITPDWIAAAGRLADRRRGLGEVDPRDARAALGERRERDLDAGRDRAAEVLAVGRDGVEVDPGAEVDHHAAAADPVVGGDRVDEPVGADLVRVVDPDRHPGLGARGDEQAGRVEVALARAPRTRSPAAARPRQTTSASTSANSISFSFSSPAIRSAISSPGRARDGAKAPVLDQLVAAKGAEMGLGVADVDREEHRAIMAADRIRKSRRSST